MFKKVTLIFLAILISACSSSRGFDRGSLSKNLGQDIVVNDTEIERILALKPQIHLPFKLGVYFNPPTSETWWAKAHWTGEDKEVIESIGNLLIEEGVISQYVPIVTSTVGSSSLKAVRLAAARYNVDAVLIINGISAVDTYHNNWAASYILLVTTAFVPGSVTDALFLSNATLWDVKNEYLYVAAEAEGVVSETRPALMTKQSQIVMEAKRQALIELAKNIYKNISNLK